MYINKLNDIINKYNTTYHRTIKIKPVDVKSSTYINSRKLNNDKILNLKLLTLLEYQTITIFLQKTMFQIARRKFL